jgi:hypothetical protein
MTAVRVLSAYVMGETTVASVELDGAVTVTGVRLEDSPYTGRVIAIPPRRGTGDGRPVLSWSDAVAGEVAAAIIAALPSETVAVLEDEPDPDPDVCPACGGRWTSCGCSMEAADRAYSGEAA